MKKIHRFLINKQPNKASNKVEEKELVHLIKNVLKLKIGEECILFSNGSDDYLSEIVLLDKKSITLKTVSVLPRKNISKDITACISIIKRDNFEVLVQKLTELGINTIIPIVSERVIKQGLKIDRLQKISDEALEQSGGSKRVKILEAENLEKIIKTYKPQAQCYFDMDGESIDNMGKEVSVFYIGPEGGWTEKEKDLFFKNNIASYQLTNTTLRAETAGIIAGYKVIWS